MRISTRGEYGIRAMVYLSGQFGSGPIPLHSIAENQSISEPYLEQLMGVLRKAGLVDSQRGASGGYSLSRPPEQITVGEILRCLEGPISPMECVDKGKAVGCGQSPGCVTRRLWERLRDSMSEVLDNTTLADLLKESETL